MDTKVSRRDFLRSGTLVAGAVAMGGLIGCSSEPEEETPVWLPAEWHDEADVVIVGYGGAGGGAAVEVARKGIKAIVLEKAPEDQFGGNTSVCVGGFYSFSDAELGKTFLKPQVGASVSDEEVAAFVEESMSLVEFLESLSTDYALNTLTRDSGGSLCKNLPGAESNNVYSSFGSGANTFASLHKTVVEEGGDLVKIYGETPAESLIFHPETKEVYGVWAQLPDGSKAAFKAKKAVIMTCGGFENNHEMFSNFLVPGQAKIWPWGTPHNTGDGVKMITEVGAKLRHFDCVEWGSPCSAKASAEIDSAVPLGDVITELPYDHSIIVNKTGSRYYNEIDLTSSGTTATPTHSKEHIPILDYDMVLQDYANLPSFMIFDEERRTGGCLATPAKEGSTKMWASIRKGFSWSEDNQAEIEKGYIVKADTIEELAEKAGIDPAVLASQVDKWNEMVATGVDDQFGREHQLTAITTPPYYAMELALSVINTQGGTARNEKHQVVDWNDNPIPRLYAAGEFGSIFGKLYSGAMNAPEAIIGGKWAVDYVVELESNWDEASE